MEYVEETVEEVQPDGSIILRRVIVPVLSRPDVLPEPDDGELPGIIPMGEPPEDIYGEC
jgi:hypothetical protein